MKIQLKAFLTDIFFFVLGGVIYSFAVTMFLSSNEISPGGITGIATAIGYLTGISGGVLFFVLNIPILFIGFKKFGGSFITKTSIATVLISLILSVSEALLPVFKIDKILSAVFGGMIMGLGLSIIMLRGSSTGGIDILAKLVTRKFRHLTVGKIILILDAVVILIAVLVYRNIESALYSVVAIYASSTIMDKLLYGGDKGKLIYIITRSPLKVCREINTTIGRGVTVINAKGGYTGEERALLLCTVRRHQVAAVYKAIETHDKKAFIVAGDVGEIIGEGFKNLV